MYRYETSPSLVVRWTGLAKPSFTDWRMAFGARTGGVDGLFEVHDADLVSAVPGPSPFTALAPVTDANFWQLNSNAVVKENRVTLVQYQKQRVGTLISKSQVANGWDGLTLKAHVTAIGSADVLWIGILDAAAPSTVTALDQEQGFYGVGLDLYNNRVQVFGGAQQLAALTNYVADGSES